MKCIPDWLYLWVSKALLGEIYPSIRAVVVGFDKERVMTLRYYLDREAEESDYESIDEVVTLILANTSSNYDIKEVRDEVVFSEKKQKDLDWLDGFVYSRKE
ncbi:MAG: colicin [Achromobacter sp.]|uniref:colicin n=1 Tax=Achromobacter sp. TaxID=134375 RepID=UPI003D03A6B0